MKNKYLITNICITALSVLIVAFLALPFVGNMSGYDAFNFLQYLGRMNDFVLAFIYVTPLLMLILGVVIVACSVVGILGNTNVIKSEKLLKVVRLVKLVAASVLAFVTFLTFIFIFVKEASPAFWYIINFIFSLAILAGSILELVWTRKK